MERASACIIAILLLLGSAPFNAFKNLSSLVAYTQNHDKYPDSDLEIEGKVASLHPNFSTLYQNSMRPGWLERLQCYFNIGRPLWCFSDFVDTMKALRTQEQNRPWNKKLIQEHVIVGMVIGSLGREHTRFVIVGELSGSLHGLTSIIQHWHETGLMDENFIVKDEQSAIIFLGNLVGSSAYDLEALTLVSTIAQRNPEKVHVLCGANEDRQRWYEAPLHQGIRLRSCLKHKSLRAIYNLVDDVFALLPDAFVLTTPQKTAAIVFSAADTFDNIAFEELLACLPEVSTTELQGCPLYGHGKDVAQHNTLLALIETRRTWNTVHVTPPLEQITLPSIKGAVWDIISGSTRTFRSLYRVRWNGYLVVQPRGEQLEQTTLEYIGRRIDFDDKFQSHATYNLVTGETIAQTQKAVAAHSPTPISTPLKRQ